MYAAVIAWYIYLSMSKIQIVIVVQGIHTTTDKMQMKPYFHDLLHTKC